MKNIIFAFLNKKKILFGIFFAVLFVSFAYISAGQAQTTNSYGLDETATAGFGNDVASSQTDVPSIVGSIIGAGLSFIGVLFFVLMIYGGFLWMTARGNEEQVKKATDIIIQASIGLVIVASAYLVTRFVGETIINSVTNTPTK